uniref:Uncharacterized protein n=1 Tax=Cajanus cajan TaxID=3821 RepID=A0A151TN20_CAJCA|nr:hypothetical protein KK1_022080 [Cajanus cajan]
MERTVSRSNSRKLPPPRGLVKIRIFKTVFSSVKAFASLVTPRPNGNGEEDGASLTGTSPSTTPPNSSPHNYDQ